MPTNGQPTGTEVVDDEVGDLNFDPFQQPSDPEHSTSKETRLNALISRTRYPLVQQNGQRRYGPPPDWEGPPPPKGCEIFIGKLPRDAAEDELVPVFEKMGKIYEMRLMMDFCGGNRGYAFVMYTNQKDAKRACQELNGYEIRTGRFIGVLKSVDNCRLYISGIPREKTKDELKEEISRLTDGVVDVILYPSASDKNKNRGFAFIEYNSHRSAAMARRKLVPGKTTLYGNEITVDWAEPERDVDEETMAHVKKLYVRNLMIHTSEPHLWEVIEKITGRGTVERVKKLRDFAFVHFTTREAALQAKDALDGTDLDGSKIEVKLAKPPDRSILRYVKAAQRMVGRTVVEQQQAVSVGGQAQLCMISTSQPGRDGLYVGVDPQMATTFVGFPCLDRFAAARGYAVPQWIKTENGYRAARNAAGVKNIGLTPLRPVASGSAGTGRRNAGEIKIKDFPAIPFGSAMQPTSGVLLVPSAVPIAKPPSLAMQPGSLPTTPLVAPVIPAFAAPAPNMLILYGFCQFLEDYCEQNTWGAPQYQLTTSWSKNGAGQDVPLYSYKLIIPSLAQSHGDFQSNKLFPDIQEAKEFIAYLALLQLGIPFSTYTAPYDQFWPFMYYPDPNGLLAPIVTSAAASPATNPLPKASDLKS